MARYVRLAVKAEKPKATAMVCAEVRQLEDCLGLSPMSMLRLRWEVAADEPEPRPVAAVRRLRAVDPTER